MKAHTVENKEGSDHEFGGCHMFAGKQACEPGSLLQIFLRYRLTIEIVQTIHSIGYLRQRRSHDDVFEIMD
jgi:hypothetical protein